MSDTRWKLLFAAMGVINLILALLPAPHPSLAADIGTAILYMDAAFCAYVVVHA